MEINKIYQGNCLDTMKTFLDNSIDAIVTDPPYGLSFMGKKWDYDVPSQEIWTECLRILKPGGYLLSFAGTRTQHRMACNIEDAGFEIRDMIAWVYGSGFPKSLNVGKAVDKLQGNEREVIGYEPQFPDGTRGATYRGQASKDNNLKFTSKDTSTAGLKPIYKKNNEWEGWGTALKPALEPITVARKPLSEKTVAENVLKWGTGGINIDGCRVEVNETEKNKYLHQDLSESNSEATVDFGCSNHKRNGGNEQGRFPANVIHDGSDEVVDLFPDTKSGKYQKQSRKRKGFMLSGSEDNIQEANAPDNYGDSGSASRFFYCAKASKSERNRGCEGLEEKQTVGGGGGIGDYLDDVNSASGKYGSEKAPAKNNHPTVKPIALMEYLVKLVSREGAVVLDPFAGSGSTLIACKNLKRNYIGCELDEEYIKIAEARLKDKQKRLL